VEEESFEIPLGTSNVLRQGTDATVVATSWMNIEALRAAEILAREGVSIEVIDPRTISPLDDGPIIESVTRTGHLIAAEHDWVQCGFTAEIAARVSEKAFGQLKSPVTRIGFEFTPTPTVRHLEDRFYPNAADIIRAVERKLDLDPIDLSAEDFYSHERRFKGPF
jgi:pyruvate/2-oxoglutarate/acetoin dehydrogenase E1 component